MKNQNALLLRFFIGCFVFSWLIWSPGIAVSFGMISLDRGILSALKLLGSCGPAIVALWLVGGQYGRDGLRKIMRSCFTPGKSPLILVVFIGILLGVHALSRLAYGWLSEYTLPTSSMINSPVNAIVFFIVAFFIGGGLGEEIGWRGFALPLLQKRYGGLVSSLILSTFWIVWHLPLFSYGGTNQSLIPFWVFILTVYPLGILLTLVFNRSGSIFAAACFHTFGNLAHELFPVLPSEANPSLAGFYVLAVAYWFCAFVVLLVWRGKYLGRNPEDA